MEGESQLDGSGARLPCRLGTLTAASDISAALFR
jgi:hypothetical protein